MKGLAGLVSAVYLLVIRVHLLVGCGGFALPLTFLKGGGVACAASPKGNHECR